MTYNDLDKSKITNDKKTIIKTLTFSPQECHTLTAQSAAKAMKMKAKNHNWRR